MAGILISRTPNAHCCTWTQFKRSAPFPPFYVRADVADRLTLDRFGEMNARKPPDHSFEIAYLERIGLLRIEQSTVNGLIPQLQSGLVSQRRRMFTPIGNRSSIVTIRNGTIRIASALFTNADHIDRCLEVTKRLL